nr:MAG TPA_asm: hypothetical protein [Caudoviricetes sp.]
MMTVVSSPNTACLLHTLNQKNMVFYSSTE